MAKKIWESEAVSIVVLPSGDQGREILDLAPESNGSYVGFKDAKSAEEEHH